MKTFNIQKKSKKSSARAAKLKTPHGIVRTPAFMPIATRGAVKNLSTRELKSLGADILLSNTYHLYLKPGEKLIKKMGGLHKYMNWNGPILTDSGGYQVFSLGGNKSKKDNLVKISPKGVVFRSHLDGSKHFFTPEKSIQIQQQLGVDIMMAFDVCPPLPSTEQVVCSAVELTQAWSKRCKKEWKSGKYHKNGQLLFGICQGGADLKLRKQSADGLIKQDFSGYALGGLAVGETREEMYKILQNITALLPQDKPRYLMGVGKPEEIVKAVSEGVDMFDCVIPTREARHGRLYLWCEKKQKGAIHLFGTLYYRTINITKGEFNHDTTPLNKNSKIPELKEYTLAYLHHLLKIEEGLGFRLATMINLEFYLDLMKLIRGSIKSGNI